MKNTCKNIAVLLAAAFCLAPLSALAVEPMAASVKIFGGEVYDYVLIGESPKATDGFDNAYDALLPGESLNSVWIKAYFAHPEWKVIKDNFRGDIRSLAEKQEWTLSIASTLPAGTPLTIALDNVLNILPLGLQLTIKDTGTAASADLISGSLKIASPAPGATTQLIITALQPSGTVVTPPPVVTTADGDVDGDGGVTITDAVMALRQALGLDPKSATAITHGDLDADGTLTIRDALLLVRKSVGL